MGFQFSVNVFDVGTVDIIVIARDDPFHLRQVFAVPNDQVQDFLPVEVTLIDGTNHQIDSANVSAL